MTLTIFTTVIPHVGRCAPSANSAREQLAYSILETASDDRVDLVVFPSGMLSVPIDADPEEAAEAVICAADDVGVAVILGVDTACGSAKHQTDMISRQRLPYWVVAHSQEGGTHCWRQRSSNSANAYDVPKEQLDEEHIVRVAGADVHVLACGEAFNKPLRELHAPWSNRVVVVPTHTAHGARFFHAIDAFHDAGVAAILRATHAWSDATVGSPTRLVGRIGGAVVRCWG